MGRCRCPASLFVMRWIRPDPHYRQCLTRVGGWGGVGRPLRENKPWPISHPKREDVTISGFPRQFQTKDVFPALVASQKNLYAFTSHVPSTRWLAVTGPTCRHVDLQGQEFGWAFKQQLRKTANKQQVECWLCCLCLCVYVNGYIWIASAFSATEAKPHGVNGSYVMIIWHSEGTKDNLQAE